MPTDPCECCKARYILFELGGDLNRAGSGEGYEYQTATVIEWWDGVSPTDPPNGDVDVYNIPKGSEYVFYGKIGDVGYAIWDDVKNQYRVISLPQIISGSDSFTERTVECISGLIKLRDRPVQVTFSDDQVPQLVIESQGDWSSPGTTVGDCSGGGGAGGIAYVPVVELECAGDQLLLTQGTATITLSGGVLDYGIEWEDSEYLDCCDCYGGSDMACPGWEYLSPYGGSSNDADYFQTTSSGSCFADFVDALNSENEIQAAAVVAAPPGKRWEFIETYDTCTLVIEIFIADGSLQVTMSFRDTSTGDFHNFYYLAPLSSCEGSPPVLELITEDYSDGGPLIVPSATLVLTPS